jgi:ABC-type multidrug transport system fused ATPase/permease subunit
VKWIGAVLPLLLVISTILISRASNALKETVRLFSTTNSPILSYFGETINGTSTIRAYERQQDFIDGFHKLLNDNILASQMRAGVTGWFTIKVDMMAISLMFLMTMICVLCRDFTNPVILAILLSYTMTIQFNLKWFLVTFNTLQGNMVNADRCMKLLDIPQERKVDQKAPNLLQGRPAWPEKGKVVFENVSLKYRPTTETVLHHLTFQV